MSGDGYQKLLTAVVPVYKVELSFLGQCFESILAQTFTDYELVIVNDGAPEDVTGFIDSYDFGDADVKKIRQENKGVAVARNAGIDAATGKYVTFIDCDDTVRNDMFEGIVSYAEENDLEALMWGLSWNYPDHTYKFSPYVCDIPKFSKSQLTEVQYKCLVGTLPFYVSPPAGEDAAGSAGAKLYNVGFLRENGLKFVPGLVKSEDMLFNLMVFDAAKSAGFLHRFYYNYRILDSSASFRYRKNSLDIMTPVLEEIRKFLVSKNKPDLFFQVYYMRCMFFYIESMDTEYLNADNPEPLKDRIRALKQQAQREPYATAFTKLSGKYLTFARKIPLFLIRHNMFATLMLFYGVFKKIRGIRK